MYTLDNDGTVQIKDYQQTPAFASFLPGISGPFGIPLWVFYVNRGQGICSIGLDNKDGAILEFQPAVKAYHDVHTLGFRTFYRIHKGVAGAPRMFEAFAGGAPSEMHIGLDGLSIRDASEPLSTRVEYSTLFEQPVAGLIRSVTITNTSDAPVSFEVLDGLPRLVPFGSSDEALKDMANTLTGWMLAEDIRGKGLYARLSSSTEDKTHVTEQHQGNYFFSFVDIPGDGNRVSGAGVEEALERVLPCIVDPEPVFSQDTGFRTPEGFYSRTLRDLLACPQVRVGRFPCGFSAGSFDLTEGQSVTIHTLVGSADTPDRVARLLPTIMASGFIEENRRQNRALINRLVRPMTGKTADPVFNQYLKQTHLDNILRGGYPWMIGTAGDTGESRDETAGPAQLYYLFSRKHGDLERDYNAFNLLPEYYSRGYGNYRDVNQNRRLDVQFHPEVGDSIIREFMSLIQPDGYNPLVVRGRVFRLSPEKRSPVMDALGIHPRKDTELAGMLARDFTPGEAARLLEIKHLRDGKEGVTGEVAARSRIEEQLGQLLSQAESVFTSNHGEGFWVDHWTYTLDLIDSFLSVYPDGMQELFFGTPVYGYTSPGAKVLPRSKRYTLVDGQVLQLHGVEHGDEPDETTLITRDDGGVFTSTLAEKLLVLLGVKLTTLDAQGIGIEMEAGKPGWYDALNGLPALFGSSTSETAELYRLAVMLEESLEAGGDGVRVEIPVLAGNLWRGTLGALDELAKGGLTRFAYWDRVSTLREEYREGVYRRFPGEMECLEGPVLREWVAAARTELGRAMDRARAVRRDGLVPTYFIGRAVDWDTESDGQGGSRITLKDIGYTPMPLFLEGIVKQAKIAGDGASVAGILERIKSTGLYDEVLGMYKVNESLAEQPNQIGRARAFTPGWLENESVWLHMEYKFLLELLKAGLGREFWQEARKALVPFLNPVMYGRSTTENSSFIVSSVHPDVRLHGRGFVARLSGSTAEFLEMWQVALWGRKPFSLEDGQLCFQVQPQLPGWLFSEDGVIEAYLLGRIRVLLRVRPGGDVYLGDEPVSYRLHYRDGSIETMPGPKLLGAKAQDIRGANLTAMEILFEGAAV